MKGNGRTKKSHAPGISYHACVSIASSFYTDGRDTIASAIGKRDRLAPNLRIETSATLSGVRSINAGYESMSKQNNIRRICGNGHLIRSKSLFPISQYIMKCVLFGMF